MDKPGLVQRLWYPFRQQGLCGLRCTVCFLLSLSLIVVLSVVLNEARGSERQHPVNATTASTDEISAGRKNKIRKRSLRESSDPLTLVFIEGQDRTAKFDLCSVIHCGDNQKGHIWSDKYVCETSGDCGTYTNAWGCDCPRWGYVICNSGPDSWGYRPTKASQGSAPLLDRMTIFKGSSPTNCNNGNCNPLLLTLKNPQTDDSGWYVLGAYESGTDPLGQFRIQVNKKTVPTPEPLASQAVVTYLNLNNLTLIDRVTIETGFVDVNDWLRWLIYTAQNNRPNNTNCLACATARPGLGTVPFPLDNQNDPKGFHCILKLFTTPHPPTDCTTLHYLFPPTAVTRPPNFSPYAGNYTCIRRTGTGRDVGELPWCNVTLSARNRGIQDSWLKSQTTPRADVWWYCGGRVLRSILPYDWRGKCALIQLVMPFYVLPLADFVTQKHTFKLHREKRSASAQLGSLDSHVYIDVIGVIHGVPDEYKARNPIVAGFESFFFKWATINKNVAWINYIYYNQQRFVNFTRNGFKGISEQLEKTSLMTWQNRMALDMLLAEKGGVCKMFGDMCCTFIPNNTAPDGSITRAIQGLTALSEELAENSGVDNPFTKMLERWFGGWSGLISSLLVSVAVAAVLLSVCGCCCIACIQGLIQRLVDTAMTKTMTYQQVRTDADSKSVMMSDWPMKSTMKI